MLGSSGLTLVERAITPAMSFCQKSPFLMLYSNIFVSEYPHWNEVCTRLGPITAIVGRGWTELMMGCVYV